MDEATQRQGGFLRGLFLGTLLCLAVGVALALIDPLGSPMPEASERNRLADQRIPTEPGTAEDTLTSGEAVKVAAAPVNDAGTVPVAEAPVSRESDEPVSPRPDATPVEPVPDAGESDTAGEIARSDRPDTAVSEDPGTDSTAQTDTPPARWAERDRPASTPDAAPPEAAPVPDTGTPQRVALAEPEVEARRLPEAESEDTAPRPAPSERPASPDRSALAAPPRVDEPPRADLSPASPPPAEAVTSPSREPQETDRPAEEAVETVAEDNTAPNAASDPDPADSAEDTVAAPPEVEDGATLPEDAADAVEDTGLPAEERADQSGPGDPVETATAPEDRAAAEPNPAEDAAPVEAATVDPQPAETAGVPAELQPAPIPELPAWIAYAKGFEDEEGVPLLSVLLELTPEMIPEIGRLAGLEVPVSFIIPSDFPDAAAVARQLRGGGQEVFLRPAGEQALTLGLTREEVTNRLESAFSLVPQVVGICDIGGVLDTNAVLAETAIRVLIRRGHAAVTGRAAARNVMDRVARDNGLGHLIADRRLDTTRQVGAISTALDRAAFTARNEGASVVVGHTHPETIQALLRWSKDADSKQVQLAPASAILARAAKG